MTDPRTVPDIADAIELFEQYERSCGDLSAIRGFAEAVEILNDYLEYEPGSPHRDFIQNLKFSYTRALLRKLAAVDKEDVTSWCEHIFTVLVPLQSESETLMVIYPELRADFDAFFDTWKEDLARALIVKEDDKRQSPPRY